MGIMTVYVILSSSVRTEMLLRSYSHCFRDISFSSFFYFTFAFSSCLQKAVWIDWESSFHIFTSSIKISFQWVATIESSLVYCVGNTICAFRTTKPARLCFIIHQIFMYFS